jgi:hypothetical protein
MDIELNDKLAATNLIDDLPRDTADLHVLKPGTNKPTGWIVTFAGPSHPKSIALFAATARKQLDEAKAFRQQQLNNRKIKLDDEMPEANRREFVEGVVARIVTWTPVDIGDGPVEFSDKAATDLLLNPKMGIYVMQFVEFLAAERAFMKDSAKD